MSSGAKSTLKVKNGDFSNDKYKRRHAIYVGMHMADIVLNPSSDPGIPQDSPANQFNLAPPPVVPPGSDPELERAFDAQGNFVSPIDAQLQPSPLQAAVEKARATGSVSMPGTSDWRVRLALAPKADYLYKAATPGILAPLKQTNGVIFPYTPSIQVNYLANYEPASIVHSNYKILQYQSSAVDSISISCDFTAQDNFEACYLLAVIHFFRSVTKMFYALDQNPSAGVPPPLCYLYGLGAFQFNRHPLVVNAFTYSLPEDVDYIKTMSITGPNTNNSSASAKEPSDTGASSSPSLQRLQQSGNRTAPGGNASAPNFTYNPAAIEVPTYVPTRMKIQITALPIVSRNDISNTFSLREYANGGLLRGTERNGGGIW